MAKVERFEDLICWQMSRKLVREVYAMSADGALSKDVGTRDQLRRAILSVMNNIAEGFARYSKKEFLLFLNHAQSSAAEMKSMLYVCEDLSYFSEENSKKLRQQSDQLRKSILALIRHLNISQKNYSATTGSRIREPRQENRRSQETYDLPDEHISLGFPESR